MQDQSDRGIKTIARNPDELIEVGTASTWVRKFNKMISDAASGNRRVEAKVPCNGCDACCRSYETEIHPFLGESLDRYETTTNAKGEPILKQRPDGSCVYLSDQGCRIYEDRPMACRTYDCRVMHFAGVVANGESLVAEQVLKWKSTPKRDEDMAIGLAIRMQASKLIQTTTVEDTAYMACRTYQLALPQARAVVRELKRLTEEERQQYFDRLVDSREAA